ncbi:MAG: amino acid adenylation domain-containing protein [Anaerolineae bacterium]|nr:amino acid adenylation domain-containing protein [Anaerolineae bacterium]
MQLQDLVSMRAQERPDALAVIDPQQRLSYGQLDRWANRMAHALQAQGVEPGDRVGIWLNKSVYGVAAMQAILRLGAAYVPLDPLSPATRIASILEDCQIKVLITTRQRAQQLAPFDQTVATLFIAEKSEQVQDWHNFPDRPVDQTVAVDADRLAYILYTSGSTGKPKGVCISHRNALAFVEWAVKELKLTAEDRLSNHAPFHFDLSVFDLYAAFMSGAPVYLIPEGMSYLPGRLVEFITTHRITTWYSVPSALVMMIEDGGLLDMETIPLRNLIFAGEPFPINHLRRLFQRWHPAVRFFNFYGPTETNVCTYYEVKDLSDNQQTPVPIGRACSGDQVWLCQVDGHDVNPGEEGILMVSGPTVMLGYWGSELQGDQPYSTGDRVKRLADGNYVYLGRNDHMVKVRGHRIELGEIEAVLGQHPAIKEVVVTVIGTGLKARIVAFIVGHETVPTLLELKRHCAGHLPRHMIIDDVEALGSLPRTGTGKVNRLRLSQLYQEEKQWLS